MFGNFRVAVMVLALVATGSSARADDPPQLSENQKLAIYSKPSVVRVYGAYIAKFAFENRTWTAAVGGTGSGFFLTPDGYIATNAHVVVDIHGGDDKAKDALTHQVWEKIVAAYKADFAKMTDAQMMNVLRAAVLVDFHKLAFVVLPNGDHLQYDIKAFGAPVGQGKDCAILKVVTENAPTLPVGDSTKVQVQEHILAIGYPGVADLEGLLDEKSQLEASVTSGTVSAIKHTADGEQVLQTDAPISHGNSGGPAIDEHGEVIGLTTFGDAKEVQGFNFLVSSQMVMEFVRQAGAKPEVSITNTLWREALALYWDAEYSDALKKMEELLQTYPAHSEAPTYVKNARTAIREGREKKHAGNVGLVVGLVVGGILLAGAAFLVLRGKKGGPNATTQQVRPTAAIGTPGYPPGYGQPPMQQHPGVAPGVMMAGGVQPGMMMAGGVQPSGIAKTMAIGGPPAQGQIAPTAFGSLTIGALNCVRGVLQGQRFSLTATGIIVGRQPGVAHVLVNDHRASGKHVWIGFENGKLVAIDQQTTNGTFINDVQRGRITKAELRDGDTVIVGDPDCLTLQVKLS